MRSTLVSLVLLPALCVPLVTAQPATEAWRPASFNARVFFGIDADRTTRHRHFQVMLKKLTAVGFKKDAGWENEAFYGDLIAGTIPATATPRLLDDPHVLTVVLVPDGYELPAEADKPVLVRMQLTSRFGAGRQFEVADKARALLKPLNFQEAVGYDHLDSRRLMGWLPVGQLEPILKQTQQIQVTVPTKGAGQNDAGPPAVAKMNPIQVIEVIREPMGAEPLKEPVAPPAPASANLEKVSADLRTLMAGQGDDAQKLVRIEVILRTTPPADDDTWRTPLQHAGVQIDGRVGPLVSGQTAPAFIPGLAERSEVSTIRLPQPARAQPLPPFDPTKPTVDAEFVPLRRYGAEAGPLTKLVRRHEPQRVAVVAHDFRGFQGLVGKQLPAKTSLLDLTGERRIDVTTEPPVEPANEIGAGTRFAVLLHSAAPADEMFLVRIDTAAPYQVEEIARVLNGKNWTAEALARRDLEIRNEKSRMDERRLDLRVQRRLTLENFGDDKDSVEARELYRKRQAELDKDEQVFKEKVTRYLKLQRDIRHLKGLSTVLLGLYWADGHPVLAGELPTLRFLDPALLSSAAWIQAIPRLTGQTWTGLFRDENGNGVHEFVAVQGMPSSAAEVNFLRWQPHAWAKANGASATAQLDLPAKAVVQVTLQWREVHSTSWKTRSGDDVYRKPLAPFRVVVLRQRDPEGKTLPTDLFSVVERSSGLPDRVENDERTALYQITLRFQVGDQSGRYALRLEGQQPESTLPPEAGKLPNAQRWELQPRLSVEAVDPGSRGSGRALLDLTK